MRNNGDTTEYYNDYPEDTYYDIAEDTAFDSLEDIDDFLEEKEMPVAEDRRGSRQRRRSPRGEKRSAGKILFAILLTIILLAVTAVGWVLLQRHLGKNKLSKAVTEIPAEELVLPEEAEFREGAIVYKGETWYPAEDQVNILFMGIDQRTINMDDTIAAGDSGQADVLLLASLDTDSGEVSFLTISRDSMVDVGVYDTGGNYLYTKNMHICLSYGYGDGREMSCENTVRSVQRLLYGIPVHAYAAMDLDGLAVLNDAVGGVKVTALETLGNGINEGQEITLTSEQVETYVRSRDSYNPDPEVARTGNSRRMERQKQYMSALVSAIRAETKKDLTFPVKLFGSLKDYLVTDISAGEITYLSSVALTNGAGIGSFYNVPGEAVMGETYAEYHVDEKALFPLVLELFYRKE